MIPIARANNVSIMLTQFSNFRRGPHDIRRALVTGNALSLERLSLLLQVHIEPLLCRFPSMHPPQLSPAQCSVWSASCT